MHRPRILKQLFWVGSSNKAIRSLPEQVKDVFGFALHRAQEGAQHVNAKPLRGYKGAGVLEVIEDFSGDTYRAVYTVRFAGVIYVLHVFQKKSKHGIATPKRDMDLIDQRLKKAQEHYLAWIKRSPV